MEYSCKKIKIETERGKKLTGEYRFSAAAFLEIVRIRICRING
jgi:hypothetical protein